MLEGNKFKMFIIKLFVYFENFKFILFGFWIVLEKYLFFIRFLVFYIVSIWNE